MAITYRNKDGALAGQSLICSKTIILPEYVQVETDFFPMLPIESSWAPNGITILKYGIKTDTSSSYSTVLEDWSAPDTYSADISTVATSSSLEAESGALTTIVAAGHIVGVDLPATTGLKFLQVWFVYNIIA